MIARLTNVVPPLLLATFLAATPAAALSLSGQVLGGGQPVGGANVTMWATSSGAPTQLGSARTGADGRFAINGGDPTDGAVVYAIASGGKFAAGKAADIPGLVMMSLLGTKPPTTITINELTTVASAYTGARFFKNGGLAGDPLGLRIAAGNTPNLVDPVTGAWGSVLVDPLNSTQTTTLATFNTLGALITAYATVADDGWRAQLFKSSTPDGAPAPTNTLAAMQGIALQSWADPKGLFALFNAAYPQPKDGSRRAAPLAPYLTYVPDDFMLSLCFAGGGMFANGRFMFDAEGNLWSGQNWLPGSQSGVVNSIGGGVLKMSPNGKALSPAISGFTGMGIDGIGWGTAVTRDRVWASSFNGKILVMDFDGKPVATEADFPFKEKFLGLMGIGVAANGDVWIADGSNNQLLFFPQGRIRDGRIVKVAGLKSPFDIVIDPQNRVWVSNSQGTTVVRFPANDPSKVDSFDVGLVVRALALDSHANVWVASNTSLDFPMPKVKAGASIMEQFEIMGAAMLRYPKPTGVISMIRPDGTQPVPAGFTGAGAVDIPWGLNLDGNNDVWIGNLSPRNRAVVLLAGADTAQHRPGTKPGDLLHAFKGGSIQMLTDVAVDPAGNVWAANNWNDPIAATSADPVRATSTWGGGSGLTVIYGAAAPVKPPRMGVMRPN